MLGGGAWHPPIPISADFATLLGYFGVPFLVPVKKGAIPSWYGLV